VISFRYDTLFASVWALQAAYNPENPGYRFCYVFYNKRIVKDPPTRPMCITEADWVEICTNSPDPHNLVPSPVQGFEGLRDRYESQKAIVDQMGKRLKLIQAKLREMTLFCATELRGAFELIRQNSATIQQELLLAVGDDEVQKAQGRPLSEDEKQRLADLEAFDKKLRQPKRFRDTIRTLESKRDQETREDFTVNRRVLDELVERLQVDQDAIELLKKEVKHMIGVAADWETVLLDVFG
jgi:hypothetical protein